MRLKCGAQHVQFEGCYSVSDAIGILRKLQERPGYGNLVEDFFSAACSKCSGEK